MELPQILNDYRARLGYDGSETMARILLLLFSLPDEIKIAEALPGTIDDIAVATGFSPEYTARLIHEMFQRGCVSSPRQDRRRYKLYPGMIELRDATVLWPDAPQELFELWEKLFQGEFHRLQERIQAAERPPVMRIVPIERTVQAQNTVLDADSARRVIEEAEIVCQIPCPCRTHARGVDRSPDCPAPDSVGCLQTGAFARALLERGIGTEISRQEALDRLAEAETAGLVHMMRNNIQQDMFICNCCTCCCTVLRFVDRSSFHHSVAPSRFRVKLDAAECVGCGDCVQRCAFGAISLNETIAIDPDQCFGCGSCVLACPAGALTLEQVRPLEHIRATG